MTVLGVLPLIALVLICLFSSSRLGGRSTRLGILRGAMLWGACAVFSLELLSIGSLISTIPVMILWCLLGIVPAVLLARQRFRPTSHRGRTTTLPDTRIAWLAAIGTALVVVTTGITAWFAPPNTWDSLNYHMPRVMHWAQLEAVRHYPTGIETQNTMSPGAEMLILPTVVLSQSDKWANFIQWFAMLASLIGVSLIAKQLGAGKLGQWAAVLFVVTLPTGIVQASSTMTDYVAGFWILCVAAETLEGDQRGFPLHARFIWVGIGAGLAILTKPVSYAFLLPFVVFWALRSLRGKSIGAASTAVLLAVGPAVLLNLGHWARNYRVYDNPISSPGRFEQHRSPVLDGRALISNLTRNAAMHLGTPSPHVNKAIALAVQEIHSALNLDVNDPRTTVAGPFKVRWATLDEDTGTNPLHTYAIIGSLILVISARHKPQARLIQYGLMALGGALAFSFLFKWLVFGGRLHHPLYLIIAPAVGVVAGGRIPVRWMAGFMLIFVLASIPWLLLIKSRPVIAFAGPDGPGSVITGSRTDLYFANGKYLEQPYRRIVAAIKEGGCQSVRLQLGGGEAEYPLWVLLDAPWSGTHIGWNVSDAPSARLVEELPEPCAIVCHDCEGGGYRAAGFELAVEESLYQLYLRN